MYEPLNENDVILETLTSFQTKLNDLKKSIPKKTCFLGWDGFIDYLYSMIRSRESFNNWSRIETMDTFGNLIKEVAGSSVGIEMLLKRKTAGGFTSNVCKGLDGLGVRINIVSAWGYPNINEVFTPLSHKDSIEVKSFTDPGVTTGLEFNDGKIMLNYNESILKINWELIGKKVGKEKLLQMINRSDLIGLGYWASILQFEDILNNLLNDIFPSLDNLRNKLLFIDLADTKRRNKKDLVTFLKFLNKIDENVPLVLSLNDQEARDVLIALKENNKLKSNNFNLNDLTNGGLLINEQLDISYLVVHSPHFATITSNDKHFWISEAYTSEPQFTTGAGDHFNAGTVLGLNCNLTPPEAILMGNIITSIFIRTGNSPNFQDLKLFSQNYMEYIKNDISNFP